MCWLEEPYVEFGVKHIFLHTLFLRFLPISSHDSVCTLYTLSIFRLPSLCMFYVQHTRSYGMDPNAGRKRIILAHHTLYLPLCLCQCQYVVWRLFPITPSVSSFSVDVKHVLMLTFWIFIKKWPKLPAI